MPHVDEGLLHTYIDGECSDAQARQIDDHVATCPECRARLDEARRIAAEAGSAIASLDVGDLAAPSWEELERRAAATPPGSAEAIGTGEVPAGGRDARSSRAGTGAAARSWVGTLRLAATVVLAFGIGWFARSVDPPGAVDLQQVPSAPNALSEPAPDAMPESESEVAEAGRVGRLQTEEAPPGSSERTPGEADGFVESTDADLQTDAGGDEAFELDAVAPDTLAAPPPGPRDQEQPAAATPNATDVIAENRALGEEEASEDDSRASARERQIDAKRAIAADRPTIEDAERADADGARRESSAGEQERVNRAVEEAQMSNEAPLRSVAEPVAVAGSLQDGAGRYAGLASGFADGAAVLLPPEDAATWLAAAPRALGELTPSRTAIVPGNSIEGSRSDRPGLHQTFVLEDGSVIVLMQQFVADTTFFRSDEAAAQRPSVAQGAMAQDAAATPAEYAIVGGDAPDRPLLRWRDPAGYWLYLTGTVDLERLRDLAARVR